MGRPKMEEKDKKIKLSVTLDPKIVDDLNKVTHNKSKFIEELIKTKLYG